MNEMVYVVGFLCLAVIAFKVGRFLTHCAWFATYDVWRTFKNRKPNVRFLVLKLCRYWFRVFWQTALDELRGWHRVR